MQHGVCVARSTAVWRSEGVVCLSGVAGALDSYQILLHGELAALLAWCGVADRLS